MIEGEESIKIHKGPVTVSHGKSIRQTVCYSSNPRFSLVLICQAIIQLKEERVNFSPNRLIKKPGFQVKSVSGVTLTDHVSKIYSCLIEN